MKGTMEMSADLQQNYLRVKIFLSSLLINDNVQQVYITS